ncbi:MAG: excinuclease ABC subunit UvrA [bacterium]
MTNKNHSHIKKLPDDIEKIVIKGARTHNLKNISLEMPRNKLIAVTGLSGSGKSSFAFDTIFAEGQRRYIESLSAYARQFLKQMEKPDVDEITGLSPAISIDQKSRSNNPRSTVATITEIYDYLRILFARIGKPHCLICGREIKKLSKEEILETIIETVESVGDEKNSKKVMPARHALSQQAMVGGGVTEIMGVSIDKRKFKIYSPIVVGRKGEYYQMLYDMLGKGFEKALIDGKEVSLRERVELSKTKKHDIDVLVDEFYLSELAEKSKGFLERLSESIERGLTESNGLLRIVMPNESKLISSKFMCPYDGFSYPEVEPRLFSFNSPYGACTECNGLGTRDFFVKEACEKCHGARLRDEALNVFLYDKKDSENKKEHKNIVELTNLSVKDAKDFFVKISLTPKEKEISRVIIKEILARLDFMINVGIEYLSLDRRAGTLSGGEAQRIRLATQLGSSLVGALYVLDEPTIGLHQRDNERLIKTLLNLRDLGNTILVVEHDEDTMYASDFLVDIGPGAGIHGGHVVVSGYLDDLITAKKNDSGSSTLAYLREEERIEVPEKRRTENKGSIKIAGGKIYNIKNLNIEMPLGRLIAVTGVSGSGKSSFVYEILYKNLQARLERKHRTAETHNATSFSGSEYVSRTILIDQSPIGRTPRSNPATYTGSWTFVRELFAASPEAKMRGWGPSRFSFNVKGGRCETCQGNGMIEVEMHFLPTVYVTCDVCNGKRFMKETLEIKYKKKNIYDILKMTIEEAIKFFEDIPALYDRLKVLDEVGLSYLQLGQSATTLSGGEAQRVKISSELYRAHKEKTIYLLDEPTIGLHYEDVKKLIEILERLVSHGNTVLVIEHNMDVIKSSDYIIDIGPDGGVGGGEIVAKGTPEEVANNAKSYTGQYLKKILKKGY